MTANRMSQFSGNARAAIRMWVNLMRDLLVDEMFSPHEIQYNPSRISHSPEISELCAHSSEISGEWEIREGLY